MKWRKGISLMASAFITASALAAGFQTTVHANESDFLTEQTDAWKDEDQMDFEDEDQLETDFTGVLSPEETTTTSEPPQSGLKEEAFKAYESKSAVQPRYSSVVLNRTQQEAVTWACARGNEHWQADQCVDLAVAYMQYLCGTSAHGNAIDWASNALPAGFNRISGYDEPQAGDLVVWYPGSTMGDGRLQTEYANSVYGHIGIVWQVNGDSISTIEVNSLNRKYALYFERWKNGNGHSAVACYIRPNFKGNVNQDYSYSSAKITDLTPYSATLSATVNNPQQLPIYNYWLKLSEGDYMNGKVLYDGAFETNAYNWTQIPQVVRTKQLDLTLRPNTDYTFRLASYVQGSNLFRRTEITSFHTPKAHIQNDGGGITGFKDTVAWKNGNGRQTPAVHGRYGLLVRDRDYTLSWENADKPGKASLIVTGIGDYYGTWKLPYTIVQSSETQNMYRLYNPNSGEHFYTGNAKERDALVSIGWKYEGVGWIARTMSQSPVYRLYNHNAGDHHYTMNAKERDALVKAGWKYEGIGWYSDETQGVPLYRQYNPNAKTGTHNYTTGLSEHRYLVSIGWKDEGIGWYGCK